MVDRLPPLSSQATRLPTRPRALVSRGALGEIRQFQHLGIYAMAVLGGRPNQEDSIGIFAHYAATYAVQAEGMGGHGDGEVASHMSILNFQRGIMKGLSLEESIRYAHDCVKKYIAHSSSVASSGMGTTFSAARIQENGITVVHSGDSPIYLAKKDGTLQLVAKPHIFLFEMLDNEAFIKTIESSAPDLFQILVELRNIFNYNPSSPYPGRCIDLLLDIESWVKEHNLSTPIGMVINNFIRLSSGIGFELPEGTPTVTEIKGIQPGDRLILASDGLDLKTADLKAILAQNRPVDDTVRQLIDKRGSEVGSDNLSIIMYEYTDPEIKRLNKRIDKLELDRTILQQSAADLRADNFRLKDAVSQAAATEEELETFLNESEIPGKSARQLIDGFNRLAVQRPELAKNADHAIRNILRELSGGK